MAKLFTALVILAVLLGAVDERARIYCQRQIEQRVDAADPGAEAKVTITGFPFLPKLIAQGRVDKITAHLAHAGEGAFVLDGVDITVTGATIDRNQFVQNRQLVLDRIDTGTVVADMAEADFDRLVGLPVVFGAGSAHATVGGVPITAKVAIVNNHLVAAGLPLSVPVPALPVLPCQADVRIVPGHLIAACTFHQIPPAFRVLPR